MTVSVSYVVETCIVERRACDEGSTTWSEVIASTPVSSHSNLGMARRSFENMCRNALSVHVIVSGIRLTTIAMLVASIQRDMQDGGAWHFWYPTYDCYATLISIEHLILGDNGSGSSLKICSEPSVLYFDCDDEVTVQIIPDGYMLTAINVELHSGIQSHAVTTVLLKRQAGAVQAARNNKQRQHALLTNGQTMED